MEALSRKLARGVRITELVLGNGHLNSGRPQGPKVKGREPRQPVAVRKDLPAHAISIKNKHLLVIFSDPNPRIHGGCFGV